MREARFGGTMAGMSPSLIVPVHNEAPRIAATARLLLDGLPPDVRPVFVLNGCTDDSGALLQQVAGGRAAIIESRPGKAQAIRAGEAVARGFPRFYVDSDVEIGGAAIGVLMRALEQPGVMLVAPRIRFDLSGASGRARRVNGVWRALPHGETGAFHHVLGLSAAGRARWREFPDLLADDSFIEAMIPAAARRIVPEAEVLVRPAWSLGDYVRVRERWARGQRQLAALGIAPVRTPGQRRALLRMLCRPATMADAALYAGAVGLAAARARLLPDRGWFQDRSSRDGGAADRRPALAGRGRG